VPIGRSLERLVWSLCSATKQEEVISGQIPNQEPFQTPSSTPSNPCKTLAIGISTITSNPPLQPAPTQSRPVNQPTTLHQAICGQWRCVANGKSGGQNDVCSSDHPISHVPNSAFGMHIYGFDTPQDRGAILLCHMPHDHSPCASGHFGNALMWMLVRRCHLFQGKPQWNDFLSRLAGELFDPSMCTGWSKWRLPMRASPPADPGSTWMIS
jgi:hypothetical protein